MKFSAAALGFAATALAVPGAAPPDLKPKGNPPAGCSPNHDGDFMVTIFKVGDQKRDVIQVSILTSTVHAHESAD